jgi:hypothetical protein
MENRAKSIAEKRFASMGMVDKAEKFFFALLLIVSGSF